MESPYWLRTNLKRKTHFSDTIVKMVKALSVVKLEQEEEDTESLFAILPDFQSTSSTIPLTQAMRNNPQEWLVALKSELDSLINTGTFKILKGPPPPGITPRSCKIVLKDKLHIDNRPVKRLGLYYVDSNSSGSSTTMRLLHLLSVIIRYEL